MRAPVDKGMESKFNFEMGRVWYEPRKDVLCKSSEIQWSEAGLHTAALALTICC